jgi:hypothetical protein
MTEETIAARTMNTTLQVPRYHLAAATTLIITVDEEILILKSSILTQEARKIIVSMLIIEATTAATALTITPPMPRYPLTAVTIQTTAVDVENHILKLSRLFQTALSTKRRTSIQGASMAAAMRLMIRMASILIVTTLEIHLITTVTERITAIAVT